MASPLYKTAAWKALREKALLRDLYRCQSCGISVTRGRGKGSAEIDHIIPHKGDHALFHDLNNLQTLCKSCHASTKQAEERRGYSTAIGVDGWPTDPKHPANQ